MSTVDGHVTIPVVSEIDTLPEKYHLHIGHGTTRNASAPLITAQDSPCDHSLSFVPRKKGAGEHDCINHDGMQMGFAVFDFA